MYRYILIFIIIACSIGILIAYFYEKKKQKRYNEVLNMVKEKGDISINDIKPSRVTDVDENKLMKDLYDTYIKFQNQVNVLDNDFKDILIGKFKDFYETLIDGYKLRNYKEVTDKINLIGYSITEYSEKELKFRVKIECISYKIEKENIVSGSNLEKVEQVLIITYKKNDKWLISDIEKAYEKRLDNRN